MPNEITAISLTEAERAKIAEIATPEEFVEWQRSALAEFVERRAGMIAQEQARAMVVEAVEATKADFPTLFDPAPVEQPAGEG